MALHLATYVKMAFSTVPLPIYILIQKYFFIVHNFLILYLDIFSFQFLSGEFT